MLVYRNKDRGCEQELLSPHPMCWQCYIQRIKHLPFVALIICESFKLFLWIFCCFICLCSVAIGITGPVHQNERIHIQNGWDCRGNRKDCCEGQYDVTSRLFEVRSTLFSNHPCTDLFQRMICSRKETIEGSDTSCVGTTFKLFHNFTKIESVAIIYNFRELIHH